LKRASTMFNPQPKKKRIKLKGKAYSDLRRKVWEKQCGRCADCGEWVPLKGSTVFDMAHLHHEKSRGAGGNDSESNCKIYCPQCHFNIHGPQWNKKKGG